MSKELEHFGLNDTATEEELRSAYFEKKKSLQEEIKDQDELKGKLKELEAEFEEAKETIRNNSQNNVQADTYLKIRKEIKEHNFAEAQNLLDDIDDRVAEWHYHQAMLYYEQGWTVQAKQKLLYTISLDENNEKYKKAYENLVAKELTTVPFGEKQERKTNTRRTYSPWSDGDGSGRRANSACCACQSLICADCCCECMGGDLIPCC